MLNKTLIISAITVASIVSIGGYYLTNTVKAASSTEKYSPIVQALVDKFGLKQDEVDKVITATRQTQQERRTAEISQKLSQAVKDGKLTQSQADELNKILADTRPTKPQNWSTMPREEKEKWMDEHKDAVHTWAEKNNVDISSIIGFKGKGMGLERGMGNGMWK